MEASVFRHTYQVAFFIIGKPFAISIIAFGKPAYAIPISFIAPKQSPMGVVKIYDKSISKFFFLCVFQYFPYPKLIFRLFQSDFVIVRFLLISSPNFLVYYSKNEPYLRKYERFLWMRPNQFYHFPQHDHISQRQEYTSIFNFQWCIQYQFTTISLGFLSPAVRR